MTGFSHQTVKIGRS